MKIKQFNLEKNYEAANFASQKAQKILERDNILLYPDNGGDRTSDFLFQAS